MDVLAYVHPIPRRGAATMYGIRDNLRMVSIIHVVAGNGSLHACLLSLYLLGFLPIGFLPIVFPLWVSRRFAGSVVGWQRGQRGLLAAWFAGSVVCWRRGLLAARFAGSVVCWRVIDAGL